MGGTSVASFNNVDRDECSKSCNELASSNDEDDKEKSIDSTETVSTDHHQNNERSNRKSVVIYNWHNDNPTNVDQVGAACCLFLYIIKIKS